VWNTCATSLTRACSPAGSAVPSDWRSRKSTTAGCASLRKLWRPPRSPVSSSGGPKRPEVHPRAVRINAPFGCQFWSRVRVPERQRRTLAESRDRCPSQLMDHGSRGCAVCRSLRFRGLAASMTRFWGGGLRGYLRADAPFGPHI